MDNIQKGKIDINLLSRDLSLSENKVDFYASGISLLQDLMLSDTTKPQWLKKFLYAVGLSYAETEPMKFQTSINESFQALIEGGILELPDWSVDWSEMNNIFHGKSDTEIFCPISHCLKILSKNSRDIHLPVIPKLIFGIVLGDIGAALYRAKSIGNDSSFIRELNQALGPNSKVKDLLDLYYMFGEIGEYLLAGYKVEILGTASTSSGGPDYIISSSDGSTWKYNIEANRKEPIRNKEEIIAIREAIDEKSAKFNDNSRKALYKPGIISVDITSIPRPSNQVSLLKKLLSINSSGCRIYKAYLDNEFIEQLKKADNSLGVASVMLEQRRKNGSGVAGVLLTRRQYLKIDKIGVAQATGSVLIIDKEYEAKIPDRIATQTYIVDKKCLIM